MKQFISIAVCLLFIGSAYAQTTDPQNPNKEETAVAYTSDQQKADLALAKYNTTAIKTTGMNANYLNSTFLVNSPTKVKILQQQAALYDLENAEVYDSSSKSEYDVVFDTKRSTMNVRYNDMGKIMKSRERFKNIALPTDVIVAVMKAYPDWRFDGNVCTINYKHDQGISTTYKIMISNDNKKKTVKINEDGNLI